MCAVCHPGGAVTGGLFTIFRRPLLEIYITDSQEALEIGMRRVLFTSLPYFLFGLLDSAGGALRGMVPPPLPC